MSTNILNTSIDLPSVVWPGATRHFWYDCARQESKTRGNDRNRSSSRSSVTDSSQSKDTKREKEKKEGRKGGREDKLIGLMGAGF